MMMGAMQCNTGYCYAREPRISIDVAEMGKSRMDAMHCTAVNVLLEQVIESVAGSSEAQSTISMRVGDRVHRMTLHHTISHHVISHHITLNHALCSMLLPTHS